MHPTVARFLELARERHGLELDVRTFPEGTRTAADAAAALGCDVARIVKSIVLRAGDGYVVALTSGANRVDEDALARHLDVERRDVRSANAREVKDVCGWSIGGVPPFGHATGVPVLLDRRLLEEKEVWAAAGTPDAVFPLAPDALREASGAVEAPVFAPLDG